MREVKQSIVHGNLKPLDNSPMDASSGGSYVRATILSFLLWVPLFPRCVCTFPRGCLLSPLLAGREDGGVALFVDLFCVRGGGRVSSEWGGRCDALGRGAGVLSLDVSVLLCCVYIVLFCFIGYVTFVMPNWQLRSLSCDTMHCRLVFLTWKSPSLQIGETFPVEKSPFQGILIAPLVLSLWQENPTIMHDLQRWGLQNRVVCL
ncbi:hypothetical protein Tco_0174415 [Tanacetum coccineum]